MMIIIDHDVLQFDSHEFGIFCYSAKGVVIVYAGTKHELFDDVFARAKTKEDEDRHPNFTSGSYRPFPGPAKVEWISIDGAKHEFSLDFESIFKGHRVLHREKMSSIAEFAKHDEPTIIVEVDNRVLSVYMLVRIPLKYNGPNGPAEAISYNRTLAFSQAF